MVASLIDRIKSPSTNAGILWRPFFMPLFFIFISFICLGCGDRLYTRAQVGDEIILKVTIDENANNNNPIAVDLVYVASEELLAKLLELSSQDWFAKRDQIKRDHLLGPELDYHGWEWVPGQIVPPENVTLRTKALAGVIFIKYFAPGDHRIRINPFRNVEIDFAEEDYQVKVY